MGWTETLLILSQREAERAGGWVFIYLFFNLSPKTVNAFIDVTDVEFAVLSGQSDSEEGGGGTSLTLTFVCFN